MLIDPVKRVRYAGASPFNEQGEPTASYKWTSWVWEITGWSLRLQELAIIFTGSENIPKLMKKNLKMSTCNQLDLETLGSWLIMPKNFPATDSVT